VVLDPARELLVRALHVLALEGLDFGKSSKLSVSEQAGDDYLDGGPPAWTGTYSTAAGAQIPASTGQYVNNCEKSR